MSKNFAIGYSMKKKMAKGGRVPPKEEMSSMPPAPSKEHDYQDHSKEISEVDHDSEDMVGRILKKMAHGGSVDNGGPEMADDLADSHEGGYDYGAEHEEPEFHDTAANSGDEDGDHQEDEDRSDMVKRILKDKMMKKNHNPRPA